MMKQLVLAECWSLCSFHCQVVPTQPVWNYLKLLGLSTELMIRLCRRQGLQFHIGRRHPLSGSLRRVQRFDEAGRRRLCWWLEESCMFRQELARLSKQKGKVTTLRATSRNTETCLLAVPRLKWPLGIFRRQAFKQVGAMISLRRVAYIKCSAAKAMCLPSHQWFFPHKPMSRCSWCLAYNATATLKYFYVSAWPRECYRRPL